MRPLLLPAVLAVAACGQSQADEPVAAQRILLEATRAQTPAPSATPDVSNAVWEVLDGARSLRFGIPGAKPFLTIACELDANARSHLRISRLSPAEPGAKALLALIGGRANARLKADAVVTGDNWHWESMVAADEPMLDVFDGGRVEATIPGAGSVELKASAEPARLVAWCRRAGAPVEPAIPPAPPV